MLCSFIAIALLYATGILAARTPPVSTTPQLRRGCASELHHAKAPVAEQHFATHRTKLPSSQKQAAYTIGVHWHVVRQNNTIRGGNLPDSQITDQIGVLNNAYRTMGIKFVLASTSRTTNATWFNEAQPYTEYQDDMKKALRKGGAASLNIYSVAFTEGPYSGLLGYSTFPYDYEYNPTDDGVVIQYATVPGGTLAPYDLGQTTTHEVGHWVGLYHTFEGGCDAPGDYVADTAPEGEPAFGCPVGRQTCDGGDVDPIHNYMDYSDDACMTEFTPGQRERMRDQIATYRGIEAKVQQAH